MKNSKNTLQNTLEDKVTAHLNTRFILRDFQVDVNNPENYTVNGTIQRYDAPANVEVTFEQKSLEPRYWMITDDDIPMLSKHVGTINLRKDVCVSDPCYDRETWCATELHNVMPGLWDVHACIDEIDWWGQRTYLLELYHQSVTEEQLKKQEWIERFSLGVDSGQMSVFDDEHYRRKNGSAEAFEADQSFSDAFYDRCCKLSRNHVGIYYFGNTPVGVVCSSGCGDGSYPLSIKEIDFKVVAMRINFM